MEFARFGSSIPTGYWGCCAVSIIQNCKVDPDAPASISVVDGDGGVFLQEFVGKTYREIFTSRLRIGEFSTRDMPNHGFLVVLEDYQINHGYGNQWLAILKEHGFEFIRSIDNSVWAKKNHIFGLFRNCGSNSLADQFTPPKAWTDLPSVKREVWELIPEKERAVLTAEHQAVDRKIYDKIGPAKFYTQAELEAAGVPITLSGIRSPFPPQGPTARKAAIEKFKKGFGHEPSTHHQGVTGEIMQQSKAAPATKA